MYDCIIIGTGAAGISAALTLKALKINCLWLGSKALSLKIRKAEKIANYPGLIEVSGRDMQAVFLRQIEAGGITITEGKATGIYNGESGFTVLCGTQSYEGRAIILATGVEAFKPVKGESEFLGRGVSYCAVCDGFLYKDKTIAVYAESGEEAPDVELLSRYAAKILLFCPKEVKISVPNAERLGAVISEIGGDMRARWISYPGGRAEVDGVFMLKQSFGPETLLHGLKTESGAVCVDREMATSVAGVFAAGDITGRPYQYAKAVGEGNVCAYSVNAFLRADK